jgi:hypothetical protein
MALFVSPVDFKVGDDAQRKEDLKSEVTFFIGRPTSTKIVIDRIDDGYHAEFAGDNSPGAGAGTGIDEAKTAAFAALDDASKTKITIEKQSNGSWTVTSAA